MKKNYIVLLLVILFTGIAIAQESQKNFINYQGVARNADNALMSSEEMTINIALKFGNARATSVYEESHVISTDANGVFSLLIGNGSSSKGNYNTLPWGSAATFVTASMNGKVIGTTEMMAVPYALSAGNIQDPSANEVLYDNSTSGLTATTTQNAIDELVTGGSVDADADPSNEFQTLNFDAVTNELSLSNGNSVTIPSGGTDADADPTNEIQTISFDAASNKISLTDGGEIRIPSGGTDADADPENELQTLAFDAVTNELSLSDGNSIVIPTGGVDGDGDSTNEIQTISFDAATNELSLSDGGTVTIANGGTDTDADPTNEIQDISLAGTELTISDGSTIDLALIVPPGGTDDQNLTFEGTTNILEIEDGNTVDLSSLARGSGSSLWNEEATHIYANNRVGINTGAEIPKTLFEIAGVPGVSEDIGFTNALFTITDNEITGGPFQMVMGGKAIQTLANEIPSNMVLNAEGGNVGIGAFPTATLDVGGDARIRGLSGLGERNVVVDADGNLVIGSSSGGSSLWGEDSEGVTYSSGNVGIGTASSSNYPLSIASDADRCLNLISSNANNYMAFNNSTGYVGYSGVFTGNNDMDFGTGAGNFTGKVHLTTFALPRLTVVASGDVGIGTTDPVAKLDVKGDIKTSGELHGVNTGSANMIPVAYGKIAADGDIEEGSGNYTINKTGNYYFIILNDYTVSDAGECSMVATRRASPSTDELGFITVGYGSSGGSGALYASTFNISGERSDSPFSFIIYRP